VPIGKYKNFGALKAALVSKAPKPISNPNAYAATVARQMEPGFGTGSRKPPKKGAPRA
jgi:hypothetical protein